MLNADDFFYFTPSDELNDAFQKVTGGDGEFITIGNRTTRMVWDNQPMIEALGYLKENGRYFTPEEGRAAILCMIVALCDIGLTEEMITRATKAMATAMGTFSIQYADNVMQLILGANGNDIGTAIENFLDTIKEIKDGWQD